MPCCLGIVAIIFPRVALVLMWLMGYGSRAFETFLWPILGFLFMPYTTCAFAIAVNDFGGIQGFGLALLIVGVILDLSSHGHSASHGTRYRYKRIRLVDK